MSWPALLELHICIMYCIYAVKKEIACSGDSEILHGLVHVTTRINSCFFDFRVVARTNSCSILKSPLKFLFFLTVQPILCVLLYVAEGQKGKIL